MLSGHIPVFLALIVLPVSSHRVSEYVKASSGTLFEFALLVLALALKHDVANFSASSRVRFLSRCSVWPQVRRSFRFSQERACGPHTPWVLHTVVAVYVWLVAETSVIPGFFPICHEALEWIAELRDFRCQVDFVFVPVDFKHCVSYRFFFVDSPTPVRAVQFRTYFFQYPRTRMPGPIWCLPPFYSDFRVGMPRPTSTISISCRQQEVNLAFALFTSKSKRARKPNMAPQPECLWSR